MLGSLHTPLSSLVLGWLSIATGFASIGVCFLNRWMFRNVYKAIEIDSVLISDTITRRTPPKVIRRPKAISWEIFGLILIGLGIAILAI